VQNINEEDEQLVSDVNHVLMNPQKKARKSYSVIIKDTDHKVIERSFIIAYYDSGFHILPNPLKSIQLSRM